MPWLCMALGGFLPRTALYNGALGISHKATFSILKTIRQKLLVKPPRLPLGTVMDNKTENDVRQTHHMLRARALDIAQQNCGQRHYDRSAGSQNDCKIFHMHFSDSAVFRYK